MKDFQVEWTEREQTAIKDLAKRQDLTNAQVIRQALRMYQLVVMEHAKIVHEPNGLEAYKEFPNLQNPHYQT